MHECFVREMMIILEKGLMLSLEKGSRPAPEEFAKGQGTLTLLRHRGLLCFRIFFCHHITYATNEMFSHEFE